MELFHFVDCIFVSIKGKCGHEDMGRKMFGYWKDCILTHHFAKKDGCRKVIQHKSPKPTPKIPTGRTSL